MIDVLPSYMAPIPDAEEPEYVLTVTGKSGLIYNGTDQMLVNVSLTADGANITDNENISFAYVVTDSYYSTISTNGTANGVGYYTVKVDAKVNSETVANQTIEGVRIDRIQLNPNDLWVYNNSPFPGSGQRFCEELQLRKRHGGGGHHPRARNHQPHRRLEQGVRPSVSGYQRMGIHH